MCCRLQQLDRRQHKAVSGQDFSQSLGDFVQGFCAVGLAFSFSEIPLLHFVFLLTIHATGYALN